MTRSDKIEYRKERRRRRMEKKVLKNKLRAIELNAFISKQDSSIKLSRRHWRKLYRDGSLIVGRTIYTVCSGKVVFI